MSKVILDYVQAKANGVRVISPGHRARRATKRGWATSLTSRTRVRCRQRGWAFELEPEWVLAEFEGYPFCFYLGVPLDPYSFEMQNPWQPSLDRIDITKGYTVENTRLTSWFWNRMRGIDTVEKTIENLRFATFAMDMKNTGAAPSK